MDARVLVRGVSGRYEVSGWRKHRWPVLPWAGVLLLEVLYEYEHWAGTGMGYMCLLPNLGVTQVPC